MRKREREVGAGEEEEGENEMRNIPLKSCARFPHFAFLIPLHLLSVHVLASNFVQQKRRGGREGEGGESRGEEER